MWLHAAFIDAPAVDCSHRFWDVERHHKLAEKVMKRATVRLSFDDGKSWPVSRLIDPGPSAYSCLARLPDDRIGLVYESGNYAKLTFVSITLEQLGRE